MNDLFNSLLNNIPFLVAAWTAVIFLAFSIGLLIHRRALKEKNAEDWQHFMNKAVEHGEEFKEQRAHIDSLLAAFDRLETGAEYNFQRAEEAEEVRQKSAEAAAAEIRELTQKVDEAGKAAHSSGESYKEIWEDYALARAEIGRLEGADTLRDRLHQILMKVYKPYHFIHTDNEKIAKHLQSLQPKRKSRAKGVKQKV